MDSKLRLKIGPTEIEYEGGNEFPSEKILAFIAELLKLLKANDLNIKPEIDLPADTRVNVRETGSIQGTAATLAAKVGCNSGPDLVIVAAARLSLVEGNQTFSRKNIIDEMKTATGYYKTSFNKNLSQYLQSLVRSGKLLESAKDIYSLSESTKKDLEAKLAG